MKSNINPLSRRGFVKGAAATGLGAGLLFSPFESQAKSELVQQEVESINWIGPKKGFTPQIGTLVSMMNWMRSTILRPVQGLSVAELDYLHDDDSNSIGAMLYHLAATEKFYQLNTFQGMRWGSWDDKEYKEWNIAMDLGDEGRKKLKGRDIDFYLGLLSQVRQDSLKELAMRDDEWLLEVDPDWGWGAPTNNYCKWFHVAEHESNHNGQIKYIKSRISI